MISGYLVLNLKIITTLWLILRCQWRLRLSTSNSFFVLDAAAVYWLEHSILVGALARVDSPNKTLVTFQPIGTE